MAEPSFAEQVTTLNGALQAIEKRMAQGRDPDRCPHRIQELGGRSPASVCGDC